MNKKTIIAAMVAGIVVPAAIYAVGPYFTNTTIDEPLPTSALSIKKDETTGIMLEKTEDTVMTEKVVQETIDDGKISENTSILVQDEVVVQEKETELNSQTTVMQSTDDYVAPLSGTFVGVGDGIHDAQGNAFVIPIDVEQSILRLEEFRSTNGPDLYVYLATDKGASDYVNLGKLKANIGNQNYEIPQGTDLTKYDMVLIWCKQFSVLFGSAHLS